jgi:predicted nucleotidyltransferase
MRIEPGHLAEVRRILAFWAPGVPVYAYGSRVHGHGFKPSSDLDLCLRGRERVSVQAVQRLKDAFMLSDIPFRVDVVDWHDLGEDFRRIIGKDLTAV